MPKTPKGHDRLMKHLDKMANPGKTFDGVVGRLAAISSGRLKRETPKKEGTTARSWQVPKKLGFSFYVSTNDATVKGVSKSYSLIKILEEGRGVVKPKRAKKLYIPLSATGRAKKPGASTAGLKYGVDYIYANQAKATRPLNFLKNEKARARRELAMGLVKAIRGVHRG